MDGYCYKLLTFLFKDIEGSIDFISLGDILYLFDKGKYLNSDLVLEQLSLRFGKFGKDEVSFEGLTVILNYFQGIEGKVAEEAIFLMRSSKDIDIKQLLVFLEKFKQRYGLCYDVLKVGAETLDRCLNTSVSIDVLVKVGELFVGTKLLSFKLGWYREHEKEWYKEIVKGAIEIINDIEPANIVRFVSSLMSLKIYDDVFFEKAEEKIEGNIHLFTPRDIVTLVFELSCNEVFFDNLLSKIRDNVMSNMMNFGIIELLYITSTFIKLEICEDDFFSNFIELAKLRFNDLDLRAQLKLVKLLAKKGEKNIILLDNVSRNIIVSKDRLNLDYLLRILELFVALEFDNNQVFFEVFKTVIVRFDKVNVSYLLKVLSAMLEKDLTVYQLKLVGFVIFVMEWKKVDESLSEVKAKFEKHRLEIGDLL